MYRASLNSGRLQGGSRGSRDGPVTDGCVHFYIHKYCNDGSVYQSYLDPVRLLQVQPRCGGRPNPLYKLQQLLEMYGKSLREKRPDTEEPLNMAELQNEYRMVFQFYGKKQFDHDDIGFKVIKRRNPYIPLS